MVEEHAAFVHDLFRRYLEIGSVVRMKAVLDQEDEAVLDQEDVRLPIRTDGNGKITAGAPISRGHLYKILSNPLYLGRLTHKGQIHKGLQPPIIDQETWDRVQQLLAEHTERAAGSRLNSDALLAGKLFDDRGNRMSPSYAAKARGDGGNMSHRPSCRTISRRLGRSPGFRRWRLNAELQKRRAGRCPSAILKRWSGSQSDHPAASGPCASVDLPSAGPPAVDPADLRCAIERVAISRTTIEMELAEGRVGDDQNRVLIVPWTPPSPSRRREIVRGGDERPSAMRPMKIKARAILIDALRNAHRWIDELMTDATQTTEALAAREGKTERSIRLALPLAFLSPALAEAAIDGRLPRGFGVKRLMDLPMAWSDQWSTLGLKAPAQSLVD